MGWRSGLEGVSGTEKWLGRSEWNRGSLGGTERWFERSGGMEMGFGRSWWDGVCSGWDNMHLIYIQFFYDLTNDKVTNQHSNYIENMRYYNTMI